MSRSENVESPATISSLENPYPSTPMHDKLQSLQGENQRIGAFLEWLRDEKEWEICELEPYEGKNWQDYFPVRKSIPSILAEYFEIDEKALEAEKRAILDRLAASQS